MRVLGGAAGCTGCHNAGGYPSHRGISATINGMYASVIQTCTRRDFAQKIASGNIIRGTSSTSCVQQRRFEEHDVGDEAERKVGREGKKRVATVLLEIGSETVLLSSVRVGSRSTAARKSIRA